MKGNSSVLILKMLIQSSKYSYLTDQGPDIYEDNNWLRQVLRIKGLTSLFDIEFEGKNEADGNKDRGPDSQLV